MVVFDHRARRAALLAPSDLRNCGGGLPRGTWVPKCLIHRETATAVGMKLVRIATSVLLVVSGLWALGGALVFLGYPTVGTPNSRLTSAEIDFGPVIVAGVLWALARRRISQ
jgi:hypothetical protein